MRTRNLTLALPDELIRRLKVIAARKGTSISGMAREVLEEIARKEEGYEDAHAEFMAGVRKGMNLGTKGKIKWARASLHRR